MNNPITRIKEAITECLLDLQKTFKELFWSLMRFALSAIIAMFLPAIIITNLFEALINAIDKRIPDNDEDDDEDEELTNN